MGSFTTITLSTLIALGTASPFAKRQSGCIVNTVNDPGVADVSASILQWNNDVGTVNHFLNSAQSLISANDPDAVLSAAQHALTSASDEPCQLMTLGSLSDFSNGPPAFTCAVQDLKDVFQPHVLDNLNTIISDPSNNTSVQGAVDDINLFRCCNVLPDVDILWQDSADDNALSNSVPIGAPRPDACANIECASQCKQEDNGDA